MNPFVLFLLASGFNINAHAAIDPALTLPPAFCQVLNHEANADVAYQAGVDVNGNAVAPADLSATPSILPKEIQIPLKANMFDFLGFDKTSMPFKALDGTEIGLGTLTVRGNQVFLNDKPLNGEQQEKLIALCPKD